jgi:glycosyltransferase involved in cell wall biosynthesis
MSKIRVVHHAKTAGYSGTDRTAQIFCKYLAKNSRFDPFYVYRLGDENNQRLDVIKDWIGEDRVIGYEWIPGKKGKIPPYMPEHDNLHQILCEIDPDIVHIHRSGYSEWPGFKYMYPRAKWIETNIFGYTDTNPLSKIDLNLYISEYIRQEALSKRGPDGPVIFNPIEQPVLDVTQESKALCRQELLSKYKIPQNAILIGRVGRADNFDPISLRAFKIIQEKCPEAWYLVVNPCQAWRDEAGRLEIKNIVFISPIFDDRQLSNFYRGLDIYAHARHDGECCPCNIQEAMMHGLPVVSHESGIYNGQSEIIGDAGFVVPIGNFEAYAETLEGLIKNPELADENERGRVRLRDYFGRLARRRAMRHFEAEYISSKLIKVYDMVLS